MAIKGRRPTPGPVAAVLGIENNKGELVAQRQQAGDEHLREMEGHSTWAGYELRNTPSFGLQDACMKYFRLYVEAQPRGYFSNADVPTLEKLCVINVLYDRAMNEYMERTLMKVDDVLGGETVDPHLGVMIKLADQAARFVKLLGIGPLDRGRPVIDIFGKPLVYGKATVSAEQEEKARIQSKYWGKREDQKRGLN